MGEIIELHNDPQHDRDFRRGYSHGAEAVIAAVAAKLPEAERGILAAWAAKELAAWSTSLDRTDFMPPSIPPL